MRHPNHRCPECWLGLYSAQAVEDHRADEQGECFGRQPLWKRNQITKYRRDFGITPPPLPQPDLFDVLED